MSMTLQEQMKLTQAKLILLQPEVMGWSQKNFGRNITSSLLVLNDLGFWADGFNVALDHHTSAWGIVEEVGEFFEAGLNEKASFDALGDITIYLCDYAARREIVLSQLYPLPEVERKLRHLAIWQGRLFHAQLKYIQGIRGIDAEKFKELEAAALQGLLYTLEDCARIRHSMPLGEIARQVFDMIVSKRDWKTQ